MHKGELRASWRIVVAAFVGVFFGVNGFSYASASVLAAPLAAAFGEPVAAISIWVTFLFLGNVVVSPLVGYLVDRLGARRILLVALPLYICTWIGAGVIQNKLWMLYLVAFAAGCTGTAAGPIIYSRVVNTWFSASRGAALGLMSAGIGLSYLVGPRLLQVVVDGNGWRAGFFFLAAIHLIPLPFIISWVREKRDTVSQAGIEVETGYTFKQAITLPILWWAAGAYLFYGLCAGGGTYNLVPFLTEKGLSRAEATTYMGILGLFSITGRIVTGLIIDRFPVAFAASALLVLEACAFALFGSMGTAHVTLAVALTGFALGGEVSCLNYTIARYFGVKHFGMINGFMSVVVGVGVGFGPPLFLLVRDSAGQYSTAFYVFALFATVAAAFFSVLGFYPFYKDQTESGG